MKYWATQLQIQQDQVQSIRLTDNQQEEFSASEGHKVYAKEMPITMWADKICNESLNLSSNANWLHHSAFNSSFTQRSKEIILLIKTESKESVINTKSMNALLSDVNNPPQPRIGSRHLRPSTAPLQRHRQPSKRYIKTKIRKLSSVSQKQCKKKYKIAVKPVK